MMNPRTNRSHFVKSVVLAGLLTLFVCPTVHAQVADWSREVLATRDTDQKEFLVCVRGNRGITAETLAALIRRERHGPAVASAAGQYFEKGELDVDTPAVLAALAKRPDIGAQAIAYAALSDRAPELIVGFATSKSDDAQRLAARLLAATAVMRHPEDREKMRPAEKAAGKSSKLNVDYDEQITTLLGSDDEDVLEYALLAAGIDGVESAGDAIAGHSEHNNPAVAMVAQYALARVGGEVDAEAILKHIELKPRRSRRGRDQTQPMLTYDPRGTAQSYAIMAAGAAGLDDAVDPLFELLAEEDPHVAVAAARSLGQIGGEGLPVRLLEQMNNDTPWPVRLALYDAVGANPDKDAVAPLRERFIAEDGRLRQDALFALLSIIAGQAERMDIAAFDHWWSLHGEAFEVDAEATAAWRSEHRVGEVEIDPIAGFYDSAVISDRPVFAVDASKSMAGKQIESLQAMLDNDVLSLPDYVKFNIVDFGGHVRTLAPGGLIPAENRKAAMYQFKQEMELTFGTRTYDAIERAIFIPEMDTVHFLSDGAPYGSHLKNWGKIDYVTRLLCRTAPVAVNMIFIPEPGREAKAAKSNLAKQMKAYAEHHAGKFVVSVAE